MIWMECERQHVAWFGDGRIATSVSRQRLRIMEMMYVKLQAWHHAHTTKILIHVGAQLKTHRQRKYGKLRTTRTTSVELDTCMKL